MPFVDTQALPITERLPGWRARIFHSQTMTFAHYEFDAGSSIHEHGHEQEEVWNVIEGALEVTIAGVAQVARAGMVAIVPPHTRHSVRALTDGKAIIVDWPLRPDAAGAVASEAALAQSGR
ncbi:MAG TPA: cupin domain-containing protein [Caulobacteraceae bacterium]|jgi:quercetin dioxygenase-like cupin family protein